MTRSSIKSRDTSRLENDLIDRRERMASIVSMVRDKPLNLDWPERQLPTQPHDEQDRRRSGVAMLFMSNGRAVGGGGHLAHQPGRAGVAQPRADFKAASIAASVE